MGLESGRGRCGFLGGCGVCGQGGLGFFFLIVFDHLVEQDSETVGASGIGLAMFADQLNGARIDGKGTTGQGSLAVHGAMGATIIGGLEERTTPEDLAASPAVFALMLPPFFPLVDRDGSKVGHPCVEQFELVMTGSSLQIFEVPQIKHPVRGGTDHQGKHHRNALHKELEPLFRWGCLGCLVFGLVELSFKRGWERDIGSLSRCIVGLDYG